MTSFDSDRQNSPTPKATCCFGFLTGPFSLSFKCSMSSETPGEWRLPLERENKLVQLGRNNAVLLPQRCPLLSKPIEELFEWEKQGGQCVSTMLSGLWKSLGLFAPSDLLRSWDRFRVVPSIAVETCRACAKQLVPACFVCVWSCPSELVFTL